MELDFDVKKLIKQAMGARMKAYAPYSNYQVGAALLSAQGRVYPGCNQENASYGATVCAERVAFFRAVQEGERAFRAIVIVGGKAGEEPDSYAYPCGICRQVMKEFCKDDFLIIVAKNTKEYEISTLAELLPHGFGGENLA
ncbi:MAG: cytidine deaminase [Lachnospiraceae bacterium]|nr:cytidine deaminase [Lachnospiraceae bacterium]MBQ3906027.1 cytidine deaminase [Lachnospiraceae bacterium]